MPLEAIAKLVVEESHTRLIAPTVGLQCTVGLSDTLGASVTPVIVLEEWKPW